MIKGSEIRKADFPIEPLLIDRWSPRAMSGEEISREELIQLFEAARWAPSSFNAQQWRALYGRRGTEHWTTFFDLLVEANRAWAKNAAVLVLFISRKTFDYNNEPSFIPTTLARHGRISRCKVSGKISWCTEWKASIMNAQGSSCAFRMNFKWRRWRQSADPAPRSCSKENCKSARAQMVAAK